MLKSNLFSQINVLNRMCVLLLLFSSCFLNQMIVKVSSLKNFLQNWPYGLHKTPVAQ